MKGMPVQYESSQEERAPYTLATIREATVNNQPPPVPLRASEPFSRIYLQGVSQETKDALSQQSQSQSIVQLTHQPQELTLLQRANQGLAPDLHDNPRSTPPTNKKVSAPFNTQLERSSKDSTLRLQSQTFDGLMSDVPDMTPLPSRDRWESLIFKELLYIINRFVSEHRDVRRFIENKRYDYFNSLPTLLQTQYKNSVHGVKPRSSIPIRQMFPCTINTFHYNPKLLAHHKLWNLYSLKTLLLHSLTTCWKVQSLILKKLCVIWRVF